MKKAIAWIVLSPIIIPACIVLSPFYIMIWAMDTLSEPTAHTDRGWYDL